MHIKFKFFKTNETTPTTVGKSRFGLHRMLCKPYFQLDFLLLHLTAGRISGLPGPGSFESQGRAGFSRFWWGRGCPGACRATASAAAPCPAEPDACVSLCPRWDDPCPEENTIRKAHQQENDEREKVLHLGCSNLLPAATETAAARVQTRHLL